jgi:hypothetical protein
MLICAPPSQCGFQTGPAAYGKKGSNELGVGGVKSDPFFSLVPLQSGNRRPQSLHLVVSHRRVLEVKLTEVGAVNFKKDVASIV